jgi:hypothetical protein
MTIRRVDLLFLAAVGLVVAGVSLLPSPREQNPKVPDTADHRGATVDTDCQRCHAAGAIRPLAVPPHPKRRDCLRCHARTPEETRR